MESQPKRWRYGVPLADQCKLQPLLRALERLRSRGLTAAMVVATFHHRRGMRDVRASPPHVPEDVERRAENRAHAEAYKERKDAEEARRKRKSLEHDELEKRRRQQRHDGLLEETSPSSSSMDSSSDDDESEAGWGPLDHLPDVRETAPGASASGLASLGGGGEGALGLAIARPRAEANMPETRASGKRTVSPMGSTAEVERATAGATQPPPQRAEGVLESSEGRPAEAPALVPLKALKVSTSSTARWVVDAQATIQHGTASARADLKELVAQGEAIEAATKQAGEEAPMPCEAGALESGEVEAPSITEATEGEAEAPRTSEAEVAATGASRASEAEVAEAGASRASEAEVADAEAPRTTEAKVAKGGLGLEKEASRAAEASVTVQAVPEAEIQEHNALRSAACTSCEALEVEGVELGSSLGSRLIALSGRVHERLWGALHTGIKRTLAIVSLHYVGIDLEAVSDGYVVAEDDEKAEEEVMKLVEAAEAPVMALARLFEEEVVPPTPTADVGNPEF
ncbi:uncharacterized protein [Miscanthus floridulus]|uniref:uncharacterized protein n=1 Tax=Miscanthus floridulus TaxID=154761 RepID=UPI0034593FDB